MDLFVHSLLRIFQPTFLDHVICFPDWIKNSIKHRKYYLKFEFVEVKVLVRALHQIKRYITTHENAYIDLFFRKKNQCPSLKVFAKTSSLKNVKNCLEKLSKIRIFSLAHRSYGKKLTRQKKDNNVKKYFENLLTLLEKPQQSQMFVYY